jgi:hypothetical protein
MDACCQSYPTASLPDFAFLPLLSRPNLPASKRSDAKTNEFDSIISDEYIVPLKVTMYNSATNTPAWVGLTSVEGRDKEG